MTYRQIWNYHLEIQQMKNSVMIVLLKERIKNFYNQAGIRIDSINKHIADLQQKYFVILSGNIQYEKLEEGSKEQPKPLMNENMTMEDFQKEINDYLDKPIDIKI